MMILQKSSIVCARMGSKQSRKNKSDVIIINGTKKKQQYKYLQFKEKDYCLRYLNYNILILSNELKGWILCTVCAW